MNKLRFYREKKDYSQIDLAKMTGIPQAKISRAENGVVELFGREWKVLADVLGCTVDELLGRSE